MHVKLQIRRHDRRRVHGIPRVNISDRLIGKVRTSFDYQDSNRPRISVNFPLLSVDDVDDENLISRKCLPTCIAST